MNASLIFILLTLVYPGNSFGRSSKLYWGDTHLHTTYSPDAALTGNSKVGPEEAYRFAKGEEVEASSNQRAKLKRPLDFLVVADHSEYLGLLPLMRTDDPLVLKNKAAKRWHTMLNTNAEESFKAFLEILSDIDANSPRIEDERIQRSGWDVITSTADKYNEPGKFTAFIGYEYTSMPKGNNLHRVLIFKDDAKKAGTVLPFSSFDSENPEDLWDYMANYEKKTGGQILAIAHNGNLSNGTMFQMTDFKGNPISRDYAEQRIRFEPLYEVTQIKGDGETHPALSPNDEFADFETWDQGNLTATALKKKGMLKFEYARSALKMGLELEEKVGVNPYKFGLVGSTDAHTGLATANENNFWGKLSLVEPSADRWNHAIFEKGKDGKLFTIEGYRTGAAGYAAVWAKENTREAIFDAMKRKETYATTGPRIRVRVFGGWSYHRRDLRASHFADTGYSKGVPMGGDLTAAPRGKVPKFLVQSVKDPDGVNLNRVQMVKGWLDKDGKTHEKVYNLSIARNQKKGSVAFVNYWSDPKFDPTQKAFYYVRVIEIKKPRWTAHDEKKFNIKMDKNVPRTVQDRAYTSPIWYTP